MATAAGAHSDFPTQATAKLPLLIVLAVSLALRLRHLNYNGPFIDESFHSIVVSYGNVPFLTGDVFLYPQLSHFVHGFAGLIGARALSAVFGTLTVGCVYKLAEIAARRFVPTGREPAVAFSAALVFSLSAPALFVSQFANYYAMSFLLFAFGMWQMLRGFETDRPHSLALGAVALVMSFATRYLLLGYLPIALLAVLARGAGPNTPRANAKAFWIPFWLALGAYAAWNHDHILAALQHAQQSGTGLEPGPSLRLRGRVAAEALGRTAPTAILAVVGAVVYSIRAVRQGGPDSRNSLLTMSWLVIGSVWMILYHVTYAHDLTMESNLTVALIFGAVLAGLGIHYLVFELCRPVRREFVASAAAAAIAAATFHTYAVVGEDQTWPDWRGVVAVARARGADRAAAVWSTADNGGMHNSWGVRGTDSSMSGNVWHLRTALGAQVDIGSPWREKVIPELLRQAAREHVDFVIGPMPVSSLRIGARLHTFIVTDVVDVPHGPPSYILRNTNGR